MARIVKEIEVGGRALRTLFNSGSLHSYIKEAVRKLEFRQEGMI